MNILLMAGPFVGLKEPYSGGTEPFIVNLANELTAMGHKVDVIAKESEEHNSFQLIEFQDSPLSMRDELHSEWHGQTYYQVYQFMLMNVDRYDVIHYNTFIPEIYDMGSFFNVPAVVTLHLPLRPKFAAMYGLFSRRTHARFVAVSQRLREQWQEVIHDPVHVIMNGISMEQWSTVEPSRDYLLWIGRINEDKNPIDAIRIAKNMKLPLRIVGKVDDLTYFNENVEPYLSADIVYEGHVTQEKLRELAGHAMAYVATSTWIEPFGFNTLEMLAAGVPVVGYDSAIPPELRSNNVSVAIASKQWQSLVEPIKRSADVRSRDCVAFARKFTVKTMAKQYEQVYQSAMESKSS